MHKIWAALKFRKKCFILNALLFAFIRNNKTIILHLIWLSICWGVQTVQEVGRYETSLYLVYPHTVCNYKSFSQYKPTTHYAVMPW